MDYNRFGRLNTKKLEEIKKDLEKPPYDMSKIFPYSVTREVDKVNRYTLSSFNNLAKDYRYCYQLEKVCFAEIKRKGLSEYQECREIKSNLYVFTNEGDIDLYDCTLIYDTEYIYSIIYDKEIFDNVFSDMKKRRVSFNQLELIRNHLEKSKFLLPVIPNVSQSILNEFLWRCRLLNTKIYKTDNEYEEEKEYKKSKIEEGYSILNQFESKNLLPYKELSLNETYSYLNKNHISLLFVQHLIETINKKFFIWSFLFNPYSSEYRKLFNKYRKILSLWQTQQVLKKYKNEYKTLESILEKLYFFYDVLQDEEFISNVWDESLYQSIKPFNDISQIIWKENQSKEEYESYIYNTIKSNNQFLTENKKPILDLYSNYDKNCGYLVNKLIFSEFKKLYENWDTGKEYILWLLNHIKEGEMLIYQRYKSHDPSPMDYDNWIKIYKSMSLTDYKKWVDSICPF